MRKTKEEKKYTEKDYVNMDLISIKRIIAMLFETKFEKLIDITEEEKYDFIEIFNNEKEHERVNRIACFSIPHSKKEEQIEDSEWDKD